MALKHNKKRNSGMIGEFFSKLIAESVVSKEYGKVESAKKIWSKYVRKGTELQKEMCLFRAVNEKQFDNKQVAYGLLSQVKKAASKINKEKLEREKTSLIREVNDSFGPEFFDKEVDNYTSMASIQILLNYCTGGYLKEGIINPAIAEIEDKVINYMCRAQEPENLKSLKEVFNMTNKEVDGLVVNIMREKMNKKFAPKLTEGQQAILQQFVFEGSTKKLSETLEALRNDTLHLINEELATHPPKAERDRLTEIENLLREDYHDVSDINDTTVTFYMTVSKLNDELKDD